MDALLKVKNLNVRFGANVILDNVSFSVKKGDVTAIVGPNGAGKTMLFRAMLDTIPYEGEVKWLKNIKIGYVPQKIKVDKDLPLSVKEFLSFKNVPKEEVYEALEVVGVDPHHMEHHFLKQRLGNLSGGELQRVLIAYAIMGHPDILLFDEPTAGIDIGGEQTIYTLLNNLHKEHGLAILLISHDLNIVYKYANNVLCLNKKRICYGPPKEALTPDALAKLYGEKVKLHNHEYTT